MLEFFHPVLRNFLQPASKFVDRPPLVTSRVTRLLSLSLLLLVGGLVFIAILSYNQAFMDISRPLPHCKTPDDMSPVRECLLTTSFPKSVFVPLNTFVDVEVMLHGYYSVDELTEIIRGMDCKLRSEDGSLSYVAQLGRQVTRPSDFRRECINPEKKGVVLKLVHDRTTGLNDIGLYTESVSRQKLSNYPPSANVTAYSFWIWQFLLGEDSGTSTGFMSTAGPKILLGGNRMFGFQSTLACDSAFSTPVPPLGNHFFRDCFWGTPFQRDAQGNPLSSITDPVACPMDLSDTAVVHAMDSFNKTLNDPVLKFFLGASPRTNPQDHFPALRSILEMLCNRSQVNIRQILDEADSMLINQRTSDDRIKVVAAGIIEKCPYRFECLEPLWQGVFVWVAVAYPMVAALLKLFVILLPPAYACTAKCDGKIPEEPNEPKSSPISQNSGGGIDGATEEGARSHGVGDAAAEFWELREGLAALERRCKLLESQLGQHGHCGDGQYANGNPSGVADGAVACRVSLKPVFENSSDDGKDRGGRNAQPPHPPPSEALAASQVEAMVDVAVRKALREVKRQIVEDLYKVLEDRVRNLSRDFPVEDGAAAVEQRPALARGGALEEPFPLFESSGGIDVNDAVRRFFAPAPHRSEARSRDEVANRGGGGSRCGGGVAAEGLGIKAPRRGSLGSSLGN